jgi:hypothetical protein
MMAPDDERSDRCLMDDFLLDRSLCSARPIVTEVQSLAGIVSHLITGRILESIHSPFVIVL